jgi:hypothetical protein
MLATETVLEAEDPPGHLMVHGVVAVHKYGFGHSEAVCSCGWTGRRRHLKAAAVQDAWEHSVCEKCIVSMPLVVRAGQRSHRFDGLVDLFFGVEVVR